MPFNTNQSEAASIEQMYSEAEQLAQQLTAMPPGGERARQLRALKANNPQLHAQVTQLMQDMEQQAGQQGVEAMRQQPQG